MVDALRLSRLARQPRLGLLDHPHRLGRYPVAAGYRRRRGAARSRAGCFRRGFRQPADGSRARFRNPVSRSLFGYSANLLLIRLGLNERLTETSVNQALVLS